VLFLEFIMRAPPPDFAGSVARKPRRLRGSERKISEPTAQETARCLDAMPCV
jgi:hypothetical protein